MPCFWCDADGVRLTRDHVKPRCAGGEDHGNIVPACDECQASRGRVQQYYGKCYGLRVRFRTKWPHAGPHARKVMTRHRKLPLKGRESVLALVAFWTRLETDRWGSSPTAALDLTVPDLPRRS